MRFNKNPLRQARNPNNQLPISEDKVRDIVKNLGIYQPSQELEATIRVVGVATEGMANTDYVDSAIEIVNESIDDTNSRVEELGQDVSSNTESINTLNTQMGDLTVAIEQAPGTLSDLDHGAPISVTGDQFPDVLSIDNSRGPVLALNESIADLAQRDEWLKARAEELADAVELSTRTVVPIAQPEVGTDITEKLAEIIANGNTARFLKNGNYSVTGPIVTSTGLSVIFEDGVSLAGPGNGSFVSASGGNVTITGKATLSGFSQVVGLPAGANLGALTLRGIYHVGTSNSTAAAVGSLVSNFNTDVFIDRIEISGCRTLNGREGVLYRGAWRSAYIHSNDMDGVQHYAIRMGQDLSAAAYNTQGDVWIFNNNIRNMYNPIVGSGSNECNAIAAFCQTAFISSNNINNVNSAEVDDCEGIYTKVRHCEVVGNILVDAGRREGSITIKNAPRQAGTSYVQRRQNIVALNDISFTDSRSHECSISIQADNTDVVNNKVQAGAGIAGESAGIIIKYREPHSNIRILENDVYCPNGDFGIMVWAYGENVTVKGNRVNGAPSSAIRLETRASGDVRYPSSGTPVCRNFSVLDNEINSYEIVSTEGTVVNVGAARGLDIAFSATTPVIIGRIEGNKLRGVFSAYHLAMSATDSVNWTIENNDFTPPSGSPLFGFFALPYMIRVGRNIGITTRISGFDSISSASSTKTTTTGLNPSFAAFLLRQDVTTSPLDGPSVARQLYVSSVTTGGGSFVVTAVAAGTGASASYAWTANVENRFLNPAP